MKQTTSAVTYSKTDIAEMIRDAKSVCKDAGIRPTEGNLRKVITENHGEAVAAQVFDKPAVVGGKKITVSDLQNTVNETEKKMKNKKTAVAPKASKPAKRKLKLVLGFPVVAVARAFGKAGFMPAEAVAAIHTVEPKASVAAIRTFVQAGRHNLRGVPAPLSKKQLKALVPASA